MYFTNEETRLKLIGSYSLERYTRVVEWDHVYLVVMAKYTHSAKEIEEYIDLLRILDNLQVDRDSFLNPINAVETSYDSC